ncbi:MAG: DsrE family protein [Planctomycetota bacterium]|jgi:intracellular sulfur oxidation DsrE/DsrF family protein
MRNSVVVVTRAGLGTTLPEDEKFGIEMLDKFFHTLETQPERPKAICFYTEGVKAVVEGSPLVLALKILEQQGVRLVACRTCLEYYGLSDKLAVGEAGGMPDIVGLMAGAGSVLTI